MAFVSLIIRVYQCFNLFVAPPRGQYSNISLFVLFFFAFGSFFLLVCIAPQP